MKSLIVFICILLNAFAQKSSLDDLLRSGQPVVNPNVLFPGSQDQVESFPNPYPDHIQPKTKIRIVPGPDQVFQRHFNQIYLSRIRRTSPEAADLLKKLQDSIDIPICGQNAELPAGYECCTWRSDPSALRCIKH